MFSWKKHFLYQIDYQYWANERVFSALSHLTAEALTQALPAAASIQQLLRHMHSDMARWAGYMGAEAECVSLDACADVRTITQALRHDVRGLQHWLEKCPDDYFDRQLSYRDNHEQLHTDWARDMLTHLLQSLTHLRGQLVAHASHLGAPAPQLDFIEYKREVQNTLDHLAGA